MEIISGKLHDEAVAEERNRMARDLHDTLEQQLVGVSLQLDETEDVVREDPQAALESLALARRMLEFTRVEARRSVRDLRSQVLETQGLEAAIRALALNASHASGPSIAFDVRGKSFPLPAAVAYHLLRMSQEALTNSLKHAHAEHIRITLEYTPNQIRLGISDDGRGFSHGTLGHTENSHFGLLGMRERAAKIGAELTIAGKPGAGCLVSITLPMKSP
jgi:signal transduction histidine kinase